VRGGLQYCCLGRHGPLFRSLDVLRSIPIHWKSEPIQSLAADRARAPEGPSCCSAAKISASTLST
jgi:hypothetical protein